MSFLLPKLNSKKEIDHAIKSTAEKGLIPRFGRDEDPVCLQLDDILSKTSPDLSKMAAIYLHMKVDYRSRLHAPGARRGIRSQVSRITPWAKGGFLKSFPGISFKTRYVTVLKLLGLVDCLCKRSVSGNEDMLLSGQLSCLLPLRKF
uniref:Uncharacterized protein n=1 Tax=Canis lupus familiaris TaxID=9615 RepID=A0A8C0T5V2_CANLF